MAFLFPFAFLLDDRLNGESRVFTFNGELLVAGRDSDASLLLNAFPLRLKADIDAAGEKLEDSGSK